MQYTDDEKFLDYDLLKNYFPAGRGWSRFLKNRPPKIRGDDFIYYGKHKGSAKSFNPPVITDLLKITSKILLTEVPGFAEEDYPLLEYVHSRRSPHEKILDPVAQKSTTDEIKPKTGEILTEERLSKEKEEAFSAKIKEAEPGNKDEMILEDEANLEKDENIEGGDIGDGLDDRKIEGRRWPRRSFTSRTISAKKTESEKAEEEGGLSNRIPIFLSTYEGKSRYNVNSLFYFDPISPNLEI